MADLCLFDKQKNLLFLSLGIDFIAPALYLYNMLNNKALSSMKKQVMTTAHQIARQTRQNFSSYCAAFASALRNAWADAKKANDSQKKNAETTYKNVIHVVMRKLERYKRNGNTERVEVLAHNLSKLQNLLNNGNYAEIQKNRFNFPSHTNKV